MRQVLDKADRIADKHARHALRVEGAHCGIQRRKELVRNQHFASRERPHQGGLAGVRIADQRHASKPLAFLPPCALCLALGIHRDNFLLKFSDAVTDFASIQFSMRFASTPATGATALPPLRPRKLRRFAQARRHVPEACDFHLSTCCTRAGIAMKNFENHHRTVHHFAANLFFKVARLGW